MRNKKVVTQSLEKCTKTVKPHSHFNPSVVRVNIEQLYMRKVRLYVCIMLIKFISQAKISIKGCSIMNLYKFLNS